MTFKAFHLSRIFSGALFFNGSPRNEDNNQPEGSSLIGDLIPRCPRNESETQKVVLPSLSGKKPGKKPKIIQTGN